MADKANTIDTATAAALVKITPTYVRKLSRDGWFKSAGRDRWHLVDVVQGYISCLKDEGRRTSRSASASRVQDARAKEIELKVAREDRSIIDTDEALAAADRMAGAYLESVSGLPARITRNQSERQRLEKIFDAERQRLSDIFAKIASSVRTGIEDAEADGEDDAG